MLASETRAAKAAKQPEQEGTEPKQQQQQQQQQEQQQQQRGGEDGEEELTTHDPATRCVLSLDRAYDRYAFSFAFSPLDSTQMYLEVAAQKQEKAERQRQGGIAPPPERDAEAEQRKRVAEVGQGDWGQIGARMC